MIDWNRVNELRSEVGEEDFAEVADIFIEEVDEVVARLKSPDRPENLEEDLHFLKGSSMNLGFAAFSALCRDGEVAAANGQSATIDLPSILSNYDASRAEFLSGLETL